MERIVAGAIFLFTLISPSPKTDSQTLPLPTPIPIRSIQKDMAYEIQSGDTLSSIASKYYGSAKFWTNLWNDNPWIEDPRLIKQGWELKISATKPEKVEELSDKLAVIYDALTAPTPTTEPIKAVIGASTVQGPTGSFDDIYKQAGNKYGVPWEILYGLHLTETGLRDGPISSGYGTGAQGPMQFMPGTWSAYGVDGNGDGVIDINNAQDAIYAAANFLAAHGGVESGLKYYGGNTQNILNAARSRGYSQ